MGELLRIERLVAGYGDARVLAQIAFVRETLGYVAEHKGKIKELIRKADEATSAAGREPKEGDTIALRTEMTAAPEKVTLLGYVEEEREGKTVATDEPK